MAAPLPVHRESAPGEQPPASRDYLESPAANAAAAQAVPDTASEDDSGIRSGMIISLLDKKPGAAKDADSELVRLQEENRRLRASLDQARERLALMEREAARWRQREQEYEALLEEKSELIRQLHQELQLAKDRPSSDRRVPREEELLALEQELLREREQLKRDEEQLMAEIRQMEVALSRERADLARQRNELQRLHQQIQTELEMASREAALRERLAPLYELHAELQRRYFGEARSSRRPPSAYQLPQGPNANKSPASRAEGLPASATSSPASSHPLARSTVTPSSPPPTSPTAKHAATPPHNQPAADQEHLDKPGFFRRLFGLG